MPKILDLRTAMLRCSRKAVGRFNEFLESIPETKFFVPDGKPKPEWKLSFGDTWQEAEHKAMEVATKDLGTAYIWGFAPPARSHEANKALFDLLRLVKLISHELSTIYDVVDEKVNNSVFKAAVKEDVTCRAHDEKGRPERIPLKSVIHAVEFDATLMTRCLLSSDLEFKEGSKLLENIHESWEVWQKGYGLACEAGGTLYVYASLSSKESVAVSKFVHTNKV